MKSLNELNIKLFADGADVSSMLDMHKKPYIKGLTTNPTLMHMAGIKNYKAFALEVLSEIKDKPISFEVFSDDFEDMQRQAEEIASWGDNVYIKIPITNTQQVLSLDLIKILSHKNMKLNITAITTLEQVAAVSKVLNSMVPSYVSVFAGRIADTGRDPLPMMTSALKILNNLKNSELIWASPRELFNIFQAESIGCPIITLNETILKKLSLIGYDLDLYSLDTVKMFYQDAVMAGFEI